MEQRRGAWDTDEELRKLQLPRKFIRRELYGEIHDAKTQPDCPAAAPDTVTIRASVMDETYTVTGSANDTVLQILEKGGVAVPSRCRSGECGWCHSYLKSGKVYVPERLDGRRAADVKFGYIHPCCTFPLSDLELEIPYSK